MKRILCVLGKQMNEIIEPFIMQYDTEAYEIHLYENMADEIVEPSDILGCLENITIEDEEDIPCIFMSDIPNLFELIYRLYHQIFSSFAFLSHSEGEDSVINDFMLYHALLGSEFKKEECLIKPIYSNRTDLLTWETTVLPLDQHAFSSSEGQDEGNELCCQKQYVYQGKCHVFEPIYAKDVYIKLDGSQKDNDYTYYYPFLQPQINQIYEWLMTDSYEDKMGEIQDIFEQAFAQRRQVGTYQYNMFLIALKHMLRKLERKHCFFVLHAFSFLVHATGDTDTYNLFMRKVLELKDILRGQHFYYISQQMKRWNLQNMNLMRDGNLSEAIYQQAYSFFKEQLNSQLTPIPKKERNPDLIVVMTIQFLRENHAPTRTALERIYTLGKLMNKQVYVINTREQYTKKGKLPLYSISSRKIIKEYDKYEEMTWKDYTFPFYQCPCEMPDIEEMKNVITKIRALKPYAIMTIGNGSILSDVCANMVPVMGIPVAFSTIPKKDNQFTIVGRVISDEEKNELKQSGYDLDKIVESTFTFDLKKQSTNLTRKELGLPEDRFLLGVIGIRLDYEVDDMFYDAMAQTLKFNTHLVFAGRFEQYEKHCERISWLKEYSSFVGYQNDILAFMEMIDLYVNPRRLGGGFSIIEAFYKGKPGVTIAYGDVAAAAGKDFCVAGYEEMIQEIEHYVKDEAYYHEMVRRGKIRAEQMTDSKLALENILKEVEGRKSFF